MFRLAMLVAAMGLSTAAYAAGDTPATPSVEFGAHIAILGGCHDCHTVGYNQSAGQVDPEKALKGSPEGFEGPWGTNFARNLRLTVANMSEDDWVTFAKTFTVGPPMPWYNVHAMTEVESRSLYEYIKSLPGDNGVQAPTDIPPKK